MVPPVMDPVKSFVRPSKFNDAESSTIQELIREQEKLQHEKDNPFSRMNPPQRANALPPLSEQGEPPMKQPQTHQRKMGYNHDGFPQSSWKTERSRSKTFYSTIHESPTPSTGRADGTYSRISRPMTQDRYRANDEFHSPERWKNSDSSDFRSHYSSHRSNGQTDILTLSNEYRRHSNQYGTVRDRMRYQHHRDEFTRPATQERQSIYARLTAGSRLGTSDSRKLGTLDESALYVSGRQSRSMDNGHVSERIQFTDSKRGKISYKSEGLVNHMDKSRESFSRLSSITSESEEHYNNLNKQGKGKDGKRQSPSDSARSAQRPKSAKYGRRPQTSHISRNITNEFHSYEERRYSPSVR